MPHDHIKPYSAETLSKAVKILASGGLVAIPTETVYGLAADATDESAVAGIFDAKQRPTFNPLIVHVTDIAMAQTYVEIPSKAKKLADAFWPGPLSMVLPQKPVSPIAKLVSAGLDTLAIRCPASEPAQQLLRAFGRPFAAPSANRSGHISPTRAIHVADSLNNKVDLIIDNGPCPIGLESTIVSVTDQSVTLLRPGGLSKEDIEQVVGPLAETKSCAPSLKPQAPGMLESHYAPNAKVTLNCTSPISGAAFLGFGNTHHAGETSRNLSPTGDLREAAANLFTYFHELDVLASHICVAPIPEKGLGIAINDRIRRAAAPRY